MKIFGWRACTNGLPTKTNLRRRNVVYYAKCVFCGIDDEDIMHVVYSCKSIKKHWSNVGLQLKFDSQYVDFVDFLDAAQSRGSK